MDLISRQAAIAVADSSDYVGLSVENVKKVTDEVVKGLKRLPSAQPEYTEHEESILIMLFRIAKLIIDLQGGYMEMTDGRFFDGNDLFDLAEKLGINY